MRIVGVARVGNEVDIVEAFVRFNLRFLDALIVVADHPSDGTENVLVRLVADGLPLTVESPHHIGFQQGADTALIARRLFAARQADYVLPLDADEFLLLPRPDYLRAALLALQGRIGCWRWRNYAPTTTDNAVPILSRMTRARADEPHPIFKVVLPATIATDAFWLAEGHHCVFVGPDGDVSASTIAPMIELKAIRLAHMPIRSIDQARQKVANARRALTSVRPTAESFANAGRHWQQLATQLANDDALTHDLLVRIALNYPQLAGPLPMPRTVIAPLQ